jgi:hypothetical protein
MGKIHCLLAWGLFLTALGITGCAGVSSPGAPPASGSGPGMSLKPPPPPPVINQSYASPKLWAGETWRVYLIASDPKGEMKNIVSTIMQPGVGEYSPSLTSIGWDSRHKLNGYIYLVTPRLNDLNSTSLTLTVQIQDTAGQYSQGINFPLTFNDLYTQEPPPPGVFKDHDLGAILINIHGIRGEGGGGFFFRDFR